MCPEYFVQFVENNRPLMEELSEYEIESILFNRIEDVFSHHQKIIAVCDTFWNAVRNTVQKECSQKHDYGKQFEDNVAIIADISNRIKHDQNESATAVLQHKVLDKQISNTREQQEKLKEEIEKGLSQEESLALEIVDLQQELKESEMKKKSRWDGIKRATTAYKSALQFSIRILDSSETCQKVRIIFFELQKNEDPQYYVDLTRTADLWEVASIHPSLKPKHEEQLKRLNLKKKQQENSDLTRFLCFIRHVFKLQRKG